MPDLWWRLWGVAMLLVGMGSLWVYTSCYRCGWQFGGNGCSNSLSQIGFKFWFYFEFLLWVFEFDHDCVYIFACLDAEKIK